MIRLDLDDFDVYWKTDKYGAFADRRDEFITDINMAYAILKPAVNNDKQHYVCSENPYMVSF